MIDLVVYLASVAGSLSIGYSVIRIGWPETQGFTATEKISYGFMAGLPIAVISVIVAGGFGAKYFFFMFGALYALFAAVALAKRVSFSEKDSAPVARKKRRERVPEKILAGDKKSYSQKENTKQKEQVFKEKKTNILAELRRKLLRTEQADESEKKRAMEALKEAAKLGGKKAKQKDRKGSGGREEELENDINLRELEKIERFE